MSIGIAAVTTNNLISGSTQIAGNPDDFDLYISDVSAYFGDVTDYSFVINNKRSFSFFVNFDELYGSLHFTIKLVNASLNYDANVSYSCDYDNEYIYAGFYLEEVVVPARSQYDLGLEVKLLKSYVGEDIDVPITCTINASATERTTQSTVDVDLPLYYVGQEVSIGEGKFNVISDNGDGTVTMLAQKGLDLNYQQSDNPSLVHFADASGWEYTPGPKDIDSSFRLLDLSMSLGFYQNNLSIESGDLSLKTDLITLEQLRNLGCDIPDNYGSGIYGTDFGSCVDSVYSDWLINEQVFWTRTADADDSGQVWMVSPDGEVFAIAYDGGELSVRPVVTISKEVLEKNIMVFYVDGMTYQAIRGMTWGEWVNSKYNTVGAVISGTDIVFYSNGTPIGSVISSSKLILSTDVIDNTNPYNTTQS